MAIAMAGGIDEAVLAARGGAVRLSAMDARELARLLRLLQRRVGGVAERWVRAACAVKRIDADGPLAGEEWTSGPYAVAYACAAYAASLEAIGAGRLPFTDGAIKDRGGRLAVRVFPRSPIDLGLFGGVTAEVWMRPWVSVADVRDGVRTAGERRSEIGVCAVLGAGNVTSIAPLDVIDQLVRHRRACVLKPHPVLAPLDEVMAEVFAPLIEMDLVRIVHGGAELGAELTRHAAVDAVHLTGSEATYDAVVFGTGDDGRRRKAADDPVVTATVTAELGNVSPTIVVPGDWRAPDLAYRASLVATQKAHNAGANCIAAQVVVVAKGWKQRDAFRAAVEAALDGTPARSVWYPGVAAKHDGLDPHARPVVVDVDSRDGTHALVGREAFAPLLAYVEIDGDDVASFLQNATAFCAQLEGTLGANVIVDAATTRAHREELETAIARLAYGCVAINAWTGVGFLLPTATWGAFPGHARNAASSGIGIVHDALLFPDAIVEKTVVRAPARIVPTPPWFVDHRHGTVTGRALTRFAVKPSIGAFAGTLRAALGA